MSTNWIRFSFAKISGAEELRCSTTDQDLDDLFAAIDKEIQLDPDVALDLLDVLEDEEAEAGLTEDGDLIKSSVYLPQDDYEMEVFFFFTSLVPVHRCILGDFRLYCMYLYIP
jgi:hypothetical protein